MEESVTLVEVLVLQGKLLHPNVNKVLQVNNKCKITISQEQRKEHGLTANCQSLCNSSSKNKEQQMELMEEVLQSDKSHLIMPEQLPVKLSECQPNNNQCLNLK